MHGLLGGRNQLPPLLRAESFIKLTCVVLNLLDALSQIGGGAARSRRRIVEFMGKSRRHRAKLDELLAFLCVAPIFRNRVASVRMISLATVGEVRNRSQNPARGRRKSRLSATARTSTERGTSSRIGISPKNSPGTRVAKIISCSPKGFVTRNSPSSITKRKSDGSPSRKTVSPLEKRPQFLSKDIHAESR